MIHFTRLSIFSILGMLLTSCALHSGYMSDSAALNTNNFAYVKRDVSGSAQASYVLGIGGLKRNALVDDAKKALYNNYPLGDNQAYVNLTVNWKMSFFFIVMFNKCTVTASIVQFNPNDKP
ncbi:MAG TPA: hypothetical protein PLQ93_07465 [Bacteroidia bacterium]|nr:hypothetical protein [Bacteroidia bacterium]